MRRYERAGVAVAPVLIPKDGLDLSKWAVVACDQYTSQPEYWQRVDALVGDAPSTLRLIYPEVYLEEDDPDTRIRSIHDAMGHYLREGVLEPFDGMVYVEREAAGTVRRGIVLCVDLERYDYTKGSTSLIRATEGTILERIPPRVRIRRGAPLELPHIMILIDDPGDTVIGPLTAVKHGLRQLYDVDLMMSSGHLAGFGVADLGLEEATAAALARLADPSVFREKYGLTGDVPVLLHAMGDGNHSLATAKAIWEQVKQDAGGLAAVAESPARFALVEIVNLHDEALEFEPIHRVLFGLRPSPGPDDEMRRHFGDRLSLSPSPSLEEMTTAVDAGGPGVHRIGLVDSDGYRVMEVREPASNLSVGTVQGFLDDLMARKGAAKIDYVHGLQPVHDLGRARGNLGIYLPAMSKHELFRTVILDGALPRKTFSMGEAHEKRFYLECRRLG
jgi:hypothetical protein